MTTGPESWTVPAPFTEQPTVGAGMPVTVNDTLPVPPVVTFIVLCDAVICGAVCAFGGEEIFATMEVAAEPAALEAVQVSVA